MADNDQLTQERERFFKGSVKFATYAIAHVAVLLLLMLIFLA
ncbi:MAG: hypothetical protein WD341_13100 [Tistlia sp.]